MERKNRNRSKIMIVAVAAAIVLAVAVETWRSPGWVFRLFTETEEEFQPETDDHPLRQNAPLQIRLVEPVKHRDRHGVAPPCGITVSGRGIAERFISCETLRKQGIRPKNIIITMPGGKTITIEARGNILGEILGTTMNPKGDSLMTLYGNGNEKESVALTSAELNTVFLIVSLNRQVIYLNNSYPVLAAFKDKRGSVRIVPVTRLDINPGNGKSNHPKAHRPGISKYFFD